MSKQDDRYASLYIPVQQAIINYWMSQIGTGPTAILLYINERTLRYNKLSEHIPERHWQKGITEKASGQLIHGPVGLKHAATWANIKKLSELGFIEVVRIPDKHEGNIYALNVPAIMAPVQDGRIRGRAGSGTKNLRRRVKTGRKAV